MNSHKIARTFLEAFQVGHSYKELYMLAMLFLLFKSSYFIQDSNFKVFYIIEHF